jgi:hypothetical protein
VLPACTLRFNVSVNVTQLIQGLGFSLAFLKWVVFECQARCDEGVCFLSHR